MEQQKDNLVEVITGSMASRALTNFKLLLCLVQSALTLNEQGFTRASAGQITELAINDYGIECTPSITGQLFSVLGIGKVTIHGKRRFVLDKERLKELHERYSLRCREQASKLEACLTTFNELPNQVDALQKRWQSIIALKKKEREIIQAINGNREEIAKLERLQDQAERYKQQANQLKGQTQELEQLEKEVNELATKLKKLPDLTERKKKLEESIKDYQNQERAIASTEESLAVRLNQLKQRKKWLTLVQLEEEVKTARQELRGLDKQLSLKRSLLDKILHRGDKR